ncbi:MAG: lysophospholipid acyltransferase family protein [Candidatus Omnitrophica bacterium]|nr:lysophospholipid acyltransferase family protein [Candidatus Omnitrophota bacterium]
MYYLFVFGSLLASIFPRNICYLFAKIVALSNFYLFVKDKRNIDYNLGAIVFDPKERRRQVKNVFINFSYYLADFFRYPKLNEAFIKKYVKVIGLDNLGSVIDQHKGVIALTAHLGNYELAGAVISLLGYPVSAVALPHKDKRINNFFDHRRNMVGMQVISTGSAVRGCFSALKTGRVLGLLGDKDFSGGGLKLEMFSRQAKLPRGAAFFALKTNTPIVPVFFVRVDKYFYHLIIDKPIFLNKDTESDEVTIINKYIAVLEKYLKQYPGQWYMFDRYWLD